MRWFREIGLLSIFLLLLATQPISAASVDPMVIEGNPTCTSLEYDSGFLLSNTSSGTYYDPNNPSKSINLVSDGISFGWASTVGVDAVIVKGGESANHYIYDPDAFSDNDLTSPVNPMSISHIEFCYDNDPPVANAGGPYFGDEGSPIAFDGTGSSDPEGGLITYEWDFGDGSSVVSDSNPLHTFEDNGSYLVCLTVSEAEGQSAQACTTVAINNVAPTATFNAPEAVKVDDNFELSLTDPYDPSPTDTSHGFQYSFDCGDGSGYGSPGSVNTAVCSTSDPGTLITKGKIWDKDGGSTEYPTQVTVYLPLAVDIKPGACPNIFNVRSRGMIPVAILGTEDFDVTEIDIASVQLEGVSPIRWALEDVATPFEPFIGKQYADDCNELASDGIPDLILIYQVQEIVAELGDVSDGDVRVLTVTGNLFDGITIFGEDVVSILSK